MPTQNEGITKHFFKKKKNSIQQRGRTFQDLILCPKYEAERIQETSHAVYKIPRLDTNQSCLFLDFISFERTPLLE